MRLPLRFPRIRLVPNWRRLHRSYTVNVSLLLAVLSAAYDKWPLFQSFVSPQRFAVISMILALVIAIVRYVEQRSLHHTPETEEA